MSLTQDLGRFVADVSFERLPAEAADVARIGFIDCIATMIAGAEHLEDLSARELTKV
jgi:2-methylcitrate dehydratase PrpD